MEGMQTLIVLKKMSHNVSAIVTQSSQRKLTNRVEIWTLLHKIRQHFSVLATDAFHAIHTVAQMQKGKWMDSAQLGEAFPPNQLLAILLFR
jgi:hypothetical protein